ncbi:MAG TPA: Mini-ribonuclease 3 [Candidatus Coproplasma excrementavium]|nr:Mini-ribonuclease 3 [Candidatus Coproplasma excrementavium]
MLGKDCILPPEGARNLNPVVLAFVGDAVYSLYVREKLVLSSDFKTGTLQKLSSEIVSAHGQSGLAAELLPLFTEEEADIFRRGRNARKTARSKHASVSEYNRSTGFEAVLGYLYLTGQYERIDFLLKDRI